jgi:phosphoglycolate phosphatase
MKAKIIVFDLDGVLFDSTEHVTQYFLNWLPGLTREHVHEMWTGDFDEHLSKFKEKHKPIEETPEQMLERRRIYAEEKSELPMHEGMKDLLDALHKKGYILTVNTAALENNCLPLLEKAGILDKFDFVATKKESPSKVEKFKMIAAKYGAVPDEMVFITDTLGDIKDAELADVPTVAVTWGAHDRSFFDREHHKNLVKIVDSTKELKEYLVGFPISRL